MYPKRAALCQTHFNYDGARGTKNTLVSIGSPDFKHVKPGLRVEALRTQRITKSKQHKEPKP